MPRNRAHWKSFSLEEHLDEWIKPLIEQKTLGFVSKAEFQTQAIREKLEKYIELGIHPWSRSRAETKPATHLPVGVMLAVALASVAGLMFMQPATVGMVVDPLVGLQPLSLYDRYHIFADFLWFSALFVSAAYVTIGRKFGHSGIAVSLGIILAVALTAAEPVLGFSVRTFGTLAILILLLLTGAALYHGITAFGLRRLPAAFLSVLLILLGVLVYAPKLSDIMQPWLAIGLSVSMIYLIYRIVQFAANRDAAQQAQTPSVGVGYALPVPATDEKVATKALLRGITRDARKDSTQIAGELAYLLKMLDRIEHPATRQLVARKLEEVPPKLHALRIRLTEIHRRAAKVQAFHSDAYANIAREFGKLTREQREAVKQVVAKEFEQQQLAERLGQLEETTSRYEQELEADVDMAATLIRQGLTNDAKTILAKAIAREHDAEKTLKEMEAIENALTEVVQTAGAALQGTT
ncbi:MAG: hypothetical protein BroJett014_11380 [Planctomycetota bacterium]|nr:MAG: hypothetical protein BroJett014_11380 [Planctomycetota bacterium]